MNNLRKIVFASLVAAIGCCNVMQNCFSAEPPDVRELDPRLLEGLNDLPPLRQVPKSAAPGEDLGSKQPQSKLESLARMMQQVEQRIRKLDTSNSTQLVQRDIANELAKLLEASEQNQANQANSTQSSVAEQQEASESDDGSDGDPKSKQGVAADESTDALEAVWGTLPERLRQQLQSPSSEDFLPRYEEVIKQYYKRVAESQRRLRD